MPLRITTLIFFAIINTLYLWEHFLKGWDMLLVMVLVLAFLILGAVLLRQLLLLTREKFTNRHRTITVIIMTVVLGLTAFFPGGLINYKKWEGTDWMVAQREGAANCMTTFRLKTNKKFTEEYVCFGVDRKKGTYEIRNDTIYLSYQQEDAANYWYGIIKPDTSGTKINQKGRLHLFKKKDDVYPLWLIITAYNSKK